MKKTIQINIAGLVFNIEEDAYDTLKSYLDSVKAYFSGYEDSEEIVADIEARIAEKFIGKNKPDNIPVITSENVNALIQSMGSVADFEAIEEETAFSSDEQHTKESPKSSGYTAEKEPKRIFRDNQRKAIAGVLAGLAHYFKVDVVWFRVLYLIGFLGLAESGIAGFLFLAYIICWIAFPSSDILDENKGVRKFYRNPENKVLGGVASGLASYFKIDVAILRVLFVVMVAFFGIGLIAYLILWISSPMAQSLTQKMEMKGEAVTIENIDSNIKQNLNEPPVASKRSESAIATLLLLPFRILGTLFHALGQGVGHLRPLMRILMGILLVLLGFGLTVSSLMGLGVFFGIHTNHSWFTFDSGLGLLLRDMPATAGIFLFLTFGLPSIATLLSGIILISNDRIGNRNFWLTGLGLWILGFAGLAIIGGRYSMNFATRSTFVENEPVTLVSDLIYFDSFRNSEYDNFENHNVRVILEEGSSFEIIKRYTASGQNKEKAQENARDLTYEIHQKDSVLLFNEYAVLNPESSFRNQNISITVKIPAGTKIKMSNRFAERLLADSRSVRSKYGFNHNDFEKLTFIMDRNNGLNCPDCEVLSEEEREALNDRNDSYGRYAMRDDDFKPKGDHNRSFNLEGFKKLDVGGAFKVLITQGNSYSVDFVAEREEDLDDLNVYTRNGALKIGFKDRFFSKRKSINVFISMPTLEAVDVSGASKLKVIDFRDLNSLDIDLSGASNAQIDVDAEWMNIDASGASKLDLLGTINKLNIEVSGASTVSASDAEINTADVEASGASQVELGKVSSLKQHTSGASKVRSK
jgi:phage shock protein PspC (stress-responsive transcriptional regulator)